MPLPRLGTVQVCSCCVPSVVRSRVYLGRTWAPSDERPCFREALLACRGQVLSVRTQPEQWLPCMPLGICLSVRLETFLLLHTVLRTPARLRTVMGLSSACVLPVLTQHFHSNHRP